MSTKHSPHSCTARVEVDPDIQPPVRIFRNYVRILERTFSRMLSDQTGCCEVSMPQCHALLELEGAGCVNLNGLAQKLELDKSTLSRTVDSLVSLGLVSRSPDPDDRRQQVICLSPEGQERVTRIHEICDLQYQAILDRIPTQELGGILKSFGLIMEAFDGGSDNSTQSTRGFTCCKEK